MNRTPSRQHGDNFVPQVALMPKPVALTLRLSDSESSVRLAAVEELVQGSFDQTLLTWENLDRDRPWRGIDE